MTGKDMFREMGNIDPKYVEEADVTKRSVIWSPVFRRTLTTAACLMVCLGVYVGVRQLDLGPKNESTAMSAESNTAATTESVTMDSTESNSAMADEDYYDKGDDGFFWEGFGSSDSEASMDCAPQETQKDTATGEGVQESLAEDELQSEWKGCVDLQGDTLLFGGPEELEEFIERSKDGEKATIELIRTFEDGAYERAWLSYDGKEFYWRPWQVPDYGQDITEAEPRIYGYLKVFEVISEDGTNGYVLGLGETEEFTLQDLKNGNEDVLLILQYTK